MPPQAAAVEPDRMAPGGASVAAMRSALHEEEDVMDEKPLAPGDVAPPGTPGTGENLCPRCGGTGRLDGKECWECEGTGKVIEGIGGG